MRSNLNLFRPEFKVRFQVLVALNLTLFSADSASLVKFKLAYRTEFKRAKFTNPSEFTALSRPQKPRQARSNFKLCLVFWDICTSVKQIARRKNNKASRKYI